MTSRLGYQRCLPAAVDAIDEGVSKAAVAAAAYQGALGGGSEYPALPMYVVSWARPQGVGVDPAGQDGVDQDVVLRQLGRQTPGDRDGAGPQAVRGCLPDFRA